MTNYTKSGAKMNDIYISDTRGALEHHFNNKVFGLIIAAGNARVDDTTIQTNKARFIDGIEKTIKELKEGRISEAKGIGDQQLNELLNIATQYDWTQTSTLKELYVAYSRIKGEEVNENLLAKLEGQI